MGSEKAKQLKQIAKILDQNTKVKSAIKIRRSPRQVSNSGDFVTIDEMFSQIKEKYNNNGNVPIHLRIQSYAAKELYLENTFANFKAFEKWCYVFQNEDLEFKDFAIE